MWRRARQRRLPDNARCEVCGKRDPLLLQHLELIELDRKIPSVLCDIHAAPLRTGLPDAEGVVRMPSRSELLAFWSERRQQVVWLVADRRKKIDRRQQKRLWQIDRRLHSAGANLFFGESA